MTNKKKNSMKGAAGAKTDITGKNAMHAADNADVNETVGKQIAGMMHDGEVLGNELIELLAQYGSSATGLTIEVYAAAKAWGTLRAMCRCKGFKPGKLFNGLVTSFEQEAGQILQEIEELPAAAGQCRERRMK